MAHRHFLIYKPYKMVSQFISNDRHQKNKRFLGELYDFPPEAMAIGRLDEASEGLLLITTNGQLSYRVNNSVEFDKEYYAQVDGSIDDTALHQLRNGVEITVNGAIYKTRSCVVNRLNDSPNLPPTQQKIRDDRHGPTSWLSIILNEGKFRQVRKMTSAVGFPTLRLVRARIAKFDYIGLESGEVIELNEEQLIEVNS